MRFSTSLFKKKLSFLLVFIMVLGLFPMITPMTAHAASYVWESRNNGLYGGEVNCLTIGPTSALYAGTLGGVFKSVDGGDTWAEVNTGLTNPYVYALYSDGTDLYAGTLGGVFKSTNGGATWAAANTGLTNPYVSALISDGTNLYAGTGAGGGVFKSADGGDNWINTDLTGLDVYALYSDGTDLYAGTNGDGVFKSTNGGATWAEANTGLTKRSVNAFCSVGTTLYAGMDRGVTLEGGVKLEGSVFKSDDGGDNWAPANTGLTGLDVSALCSDGTDLYAGTNGGGVFKSVDGGDNWVNTDLTNQSVLALYLDGTTFYAGTTYGGLFKSTNGGDTWAEVNTGLTNPHILTLISDGTNLYAGAGSAAVVGGLFKSTDGGDNWINTGLNGLVVLALISDGTDLYAGTGDGGGSGVFKSADGGDNWAAANIDLTSIGVSALYSDGTDLYAGTNGGGVFKSGDGGANWAEANNGLTNRTVYALYSDGTNLYAGTDGGVTLDGGLFKSADGGDTWINTGLNGMDVYALCSVGTNLYAGTYDGGVFKNGDGGVFKSGDGGATWANIGLVNQDVRALYSDGTDLYAGADGGVFKSTNGGDTWAAINTGLVNQNVYALCSDGTTLYAGTDGGGGVFALVPSKPGATGGGASSTLKAADYQLVTLKDGEGKLVASFDTVANTPKNGVLTLTTTKEIDSYIFGFNLERLKELEAKNKGGGFHVETPGASYQLPFGMVGVVDGLAGYIAENNPVLKELTLELTMKKLTGADLEKARAAYEKAYPNGEAVSGFWDIRLAVTDKDGNAINIDVNQFNTAIAFEIGTEGKAGAILVYHPQTGGFGFVPANRFDNDKAYGQTNHHSIYAAVKNNVSFDDVQAGAWYEPLVTKAADKGLVSGVGNGRYAPERSVTRAEFVQMIVNAMQLSGIEISAAAYEDVTQGAWYYDGVMKAKTADLLDSFTGADFNPDTPVTREEMAVILAAAVRLRSVATTEDIIDVSTVFSDYIELDTNNLNDIELIYKLKIMQGVGGGRFDPNGAVTRGQAATVQINLLKALNMID